MYPGVDYLNYRVDFINRIKGLPQMSSLRSNALIPGPSNLSTGKVSKY